MPRSEPDFGGAVRREREGAVDRLGSTFLPVVERHVVWKTFREKSTSQQEEMAIPRETPKTLSHPAANVCVLS